MQRGFRKLGESEAVKQAAAYKRFLPGTRLKQLKTVFFFDTESAITRQAQRAASAYTIVTPQ
jgi:hypothetical protein